MGEGLLFTVEPGAFRGTLVDVDEVEGEEAEEEEDGDDLHHWISFELM